jgi:hypothetical protein
MEQFVHPIKVLNTEELETVNAYIDTLEFNKSTTFGADESVIHNEVRTSTGSVMSDEHPVTDIVHKRINECLIEYKSRIVDQLRIVEDSYPVPGAFMTSSHREGIQVLDYENGQKYSWHFDECTNPESEFYHRKISVVLYLTDGFEGGYTSFKFGQYKPPAGYALFFPSNWCFPHCSTEVTSGKKRVAVTWYYTKDLMV